MKNIIQSTYKLKSDCVCNVCLGKIKAGEKHYFNVDMTKGNFYSFRSHTNCAIDKYIKYRRR